MTLAILAVLAYVGLTGAINIAAPLIAGVMGPVRHEPKVRHHTRIRRKELCGK